MADMHTVVVGRDAMACRFDVVFNIDERPEATEAAVEALDLVDGIESRLTIYREGGELAALNQRAADGWQPVSPAVLDLLLLAERLHRATDGAYDMAAGALARAWGFVERRGRIPDPMLLAAAREVSGWGLVAIDREGHLVRFTRPGVELNPGGIGKGWAVDQAVEFLRWRDIEDCLVHGGASSVRACGGRGRSGCRLAGWPVGLRHPLRPGRRLGTVWLRNGALGTSGSGTQFFVDGGRRLGHILDPRTGWPAEGVLAATVLAATAAEADALATAAYVLGPEGIDRIAGVEGANGIIMVVPGANAAEIRVLLRGINPDICEISSEPGIEVISEP